MSALVTPDEARNIAKDAYIFLYPVVENYKTMWTQAVDIGGPHYTKPFNVFDHSRELTDATMTSIVTPNNDTLYSVVRILLVIGTHAIAN